MARYIDADHLFDRMRQAKNNQPELGDVYEDEIEIMAEWIRTEPTADVRENVRGEWIIRKCALGHEYTECSNCNTVFDIKTHNGTLEWIDLRGASFCPNCGADMRGDEHEND